MLIFCVSSSLILIMSIYLFCRVGRVCGCLAVVCCFVDFFLSSIYWKEKMIISYSLWKTKTIKIWKIVRIFWTHDKLFYWQEIPKLARYRFFIVWENVFGPKFCEIYRDLLWNKMYMICFFFYFSEKILSLCLVVHCLIFHEFMTLTYLFIEFYDVCLILEFPF